MTLRELRKQADLTLKTVADALGISETFLRDVEAGRRRPLAARHDEALVRVLGCTLAEVQALRPTCPTCGQGL